MGANSLSLPPVVVVVLCFLFAVSSSHAACFDACIKSVTEGSSPSAEAIAEVVDCTTKCALGEQGELKMMEELISLDQILPKCKYDPCFLRCRMTPLACAKKCKCRLLASFANDHDQEMTEEHISMDEKLTAKCKYNVCYRACRQVGGSKEYCANKCHCSQLTLSMDEKLMAKCKYNVCYRACRQVGGSKEYCAKKCNCSQLTLSSFELDRKVKMAEEEANNEASTAASA